jgi:LmbE family N-acetylglucosaminyl deacetylase
MKSSKVVLASIFAMMQLCSISTNIYAQAPAKPSSSKILQDLKKLNVLGNVMYMAAHPDDENTTLISYLANEKLFNTSYLALTRGDGGQNLIGPEIREGLGVIRTQELLQARRLDGGRQYFTRANDFGFSKNPQEVFSIWNRETLLADVVWVIRNVKPDIMITRFPKDSRAGHGQHSASSILAEDAFVAAADPKRFPEQLKYVSVWKVKRLVWNLSSWGFRNPEEFEKSAKNLIKMDVGQFNPLLGKSYGELSAESRSMHRSQGFGSTGSRGSYMDYFQHTMGDSAKVDLFEGVNTAWSRIPNSSKVQLAINKAINSYNPSNPSAIVPQLILAKKEIQLLPESYWKETKLNEIQNIIQASTGLFLEAIAGNSSVSPGQSFKLQLEVINRSAIPMSIVSINYPYKADSMVNAALVANTGKKFMSSSIVPANTPYSQPYWLERKDSLGLFYIAKQENVGLPENRPVANVKIVMSVAGTPITFTIPVKYKYNDAVTGEIYQPFIISPPVFSNIAEKVYMFTDNKPKQVNITVKSGKANLKGVLELKIPGDWKVSPASAPFTFAKEGQEQTFQFMVSSPENAKEDEFQAVVTIDGNSYNKSINTISYEHIPVQVSFPVASAKVVKLDLVKKGKNIGYLMGAGDEVPGSLKQIGYDVTLLADGDMYKENLEKFDAIILGVRAYNTVDRITIYHSKLMEYVNNGGNLIVQYNTNNGLLMNPGPFPFKISRDRVTEENAEVVFLKPEHPVLNTPNKISTTDFNGWVQERGLYFSNEWSKEYEAIIATGDTGEAKLNGGLLIAKYGKGNFIFTGYSWFRQLPAGVPGAYRLFTNLISLGK